MPSQKGKGRRRKRKASEAAAESCEEGQGGYQQQHGSPMLSQSQRYVPKFGAKRGRTSGPVTKDRYKEEEATEGPPALRSKESETTFQVK